MDAESELELDFIFSKMAIVKERLKVASLENQPSYRQEMSELRNRLYLLVSKFKAADLEPRPNGH